MANICTTEFRLVGSKEQLIPIVNAFSRRITSISVYDLMKEVGLNPDEQKYIGYSLRGCINFVRTKHTGENLYVSLVEESAWSATRCIEWIAEKYGFTYYFYEEEPGNGIYVTNDEEGLYFPYRWSVDIYHDGSFENRQFLTEQGSLNWINEVLLTSYTNLKDAQSDERVFINEIIVVDEL